MYPIVPSLSLIAVWKTYTYTAKHVYLYVVLDLYMCDEQIRCVCAIYMHNIPKFCVCIKNASWLILCVYVHVNDMPRHNIWFYVLTSPISYPSILFSPTSLKSISYWKSRLYIYIPFSLSCFLITCFSILTIMSRLSFFISPFVVLRLVVSKTFKIFFLAK